MKSTRTLERLYDQLAPKERLLAALDSLSREDHAELGRLGRTCPRRTYEMADAAYTDPFYATERIAAMFGLLWLSAAQDYRLSVAASDSFIHSTRNFWQGLIVGANAAWKRAQRKGRCFEVDGREPTAEQTWQMGFAVAVESFPQEYEDAHRLRAAQLKGIHEGFVRFCRSISLEPEHVLSWYPPVLADIEDLRGLLENEDVVAGEEAAEIVHRALLCCWPESKDGGVS